MFVARPRTRRQRSAFREREGVARLENSIAVLPFANISNEPDNEYFCDGISEEILNALSGFRQLNVIGRTSSFAFKGSDVGIDQISAVLGVGHVLQGSVRKAGNQLRISAQLLDETGRQVWTETFDRELANVFEIQSEIAAAVAAKVASQVTSSAAAGRQPDLDAYEHFLAGRALLHRRDIDGALAELQRAIEIDPDFAEAHAEWAIGRLIGDVSGRHLDAARAAIDRALALQPKLLRAQAAQGFLLLQSRSSRSGRGRGDPARRAGAGSQHERCPAVARQLAERAGPERRCAGCPAKSRANRPTPSIDHGESCAGTDVARQGSRSASRFSKTPRGSRSQDTGRSSCCASCTSEPGDWSN